MYRFDTESQHTDLSLHGFRLLIEYLKSYFMIIGGIVVVLGFIALPATVTGVSIVLGLILGFIYVYIKITLTNAYKILRYGPPNKEYIKKRKQETYHQSQQDFSGNYQRESAQQHFHDKSQQEYQQQQTKERKSQQERSYSYNQQESYEKEQARQSDKQERQRKPDLSMPSTISEACAILGTQPGLPLEEYKRIWKKEALRYHPDRTRDLGERLQKYAEEEMKRINKAWEIIKSAA